MPIGKNLATKSVYNMSITGKEPCIFLSHKSIDKKITKAIGDYICKAGINIYLDEYDEKLQSATYKNDSEKIVECIQNGLAKSTHVLCILSEETVKSWWVPYEIGYGDNLEKNIASIRLNNISKKAIPEYLHIHDILDNIGDLNKYLKNVAKSQKMQLNEAYHKGIYESINFDGVLESSMYEAHPLEFCIDKW